ncbi:hypothetical protein ACLOJK_003988 [Asimina triloba]
MDAVRGLDLLAQGAVSPLAGAEIGVGRRCAGEDDDGVERVIVRWWPDLTGRGERRAAVAETRRRTTWLLPAEALSSAMDKAGAGSDGGWMVLARDRGR